MNESPSDILLHVVHTHFETLLAAWLRGAHDPSTEMLVVRVEAKQASYRCHGEFWTLQDVRDRLARLRGGSEFFSHNLFVQGLDRALPVIILPPGTLLPTRPFVTSPVLLHQTTAEEGAGL
jgi:hypothetical protein